MIYPASNVTVPQLRDPDLEQGISVYSLSTACEIGQMLRLSQVGLAVS